MDYEARLSECGTFLIVTAADDLLLDSALELMREIAANLAEHKLERLLLDVSHVDVDPAIGDQYWFAQAFAETGIPPSARIATYAGERARDHLFVELALRNTGVEVRVFGVYDDAVSWLKDEEGLPR